MGFEVAVLDDLTACISEATGSAGRAGEGRSEKRLDGGDNISVLDLFLTMIQSLKFVLRVQTPQFLRFSCPEPHCCYCLIICVQQEVQRVEKLAY
jgi:hypothetical protein